MQERESRGDEWDQKWAWIPAVPPYIPRYPQPFHTSPPLTPHLPSVSRPSLLLSRVLPFSPPLIFSLFLSPIPFYPRISYAFVRSLSLYQAFVFELHFWIGCQFTRPIHCCSSQMYTYFLFLYVCPACVAVGEMHV